MGFSVQEFERGLSRVLGPNALTIEAPGRAIIRASDKARLITTYVQRPPRKIALLEIPVLAVTLLLEGFADKAAEDDMLTRFNHALQRGGG